MDSTGSTTDEDINDAPRMDVVHYRNPYQEDADREPTPNRGPTPNREPTPNEEPAAEPSTDQQQGQVCFYNTPTGKVVMSFGAAVFQETAPATQTPPLSHIEPCASHVNKNWVIAIVSLRGSGEPDLKSLAGHNGMLDSPFFVGKVAGLPELAVMWRCPPKDKHKAKKLEVEWDGELSFFAKAAAPDEKSEARK